MTLQYDCKYEILLVGDSRVGKTSMASHFSTNNEIFNEKYYPTSADMLKIVLLTFNLAKVMLYIRDIGMDKRNIKYEEKYIAQAQGIIYVYDVTNRTSFERIDQWVRSTSQFNKRNIPKILVANKIDQKRIVSSIEGKKYAQKMGLQFMEVSVKTIKSKKESPIFEIMESIHKKLKTQCQLNVAVNQQKGSIQSYQDYSQNSRAQKRELKGDDQTYQINPQEGHRRRLLSEYRFYEFKKGELNIDQKTNYTLHSACLSVQSDEEGKQCKGQKNPFFFYLSIFGFMTFNAFLLVSK